MPTAVSRSIRAHVLGGLFALLGTITLAQTVVLSPEQSIDRKEIQRLNEAVPVIAAQIHEILKAQRPFAPEQDAAFKTAIVRTTFEGTLFKVYGDIADQLGVRPQFDSAAQQIGFAEYAEFVDVITPIHQMYVINTVARLSLRMRAEGMAPDMKIADNTNVFRFLSDPSSPEDLRAVMNADLPEFYEKVLGYQPDETLLRAYADSTIDFEALYHFGD